MVARGATIVYKGNIMKYTEGAPATGDTQLAKDVWCRRTGWRTLVCHSGRCKPGAGIIIKDAIADITLQQVPTRPAEFDVIATLNLNGDYPVMPCCPGGWYRYRTGANINYTTGHAMG